MELELTEDQEFLRRTTHKFLAAECPISAVRALEDDPVGYPAEWWQRGAELGWTSMLVPAEHGGGSLSEHGLLDLVLVAEEMGRLVSPGPLVPTNVVAGAVAESGSVEQCASLLPGIISGEVVAAWCGSEPVDADAGKDEGFVLRGSCAPVEAGAQAQQLLVAVRTEGGLTQVLVPAGAPGVTVTPMQSLDLVRRYADVHLDGVAVPAEAVLGDVGGADDDIERQLQVAVVLQCAETVGAADRVLEMTLDYVGDRYSFGRPLSSYQALKHRFADMKMWLEACHATASAAARAVARADERAGELVSAAKSYIAPHASEIIQDCVQMHGGIGVTWEHDLHLYLRRVTVNRATYGTPADHRERIAASVLGPAA